MLLDALCGVDLLRKQNDRYALSPESEAFLVSSKPSFQGGIFKHISKQLMAKWMHLSESVKTGKPATTVNQQKEGAAFFEQFVEDIFPMSYGAAQVLGEALKLPAARETVNVLDIAAGSGVWGVALAQKSNHVHVTAVDWPGVIPVTRRVAKRYGVLDRFNFIEGDINSVGLGNNYHVATLGHIIHSEGEARSRKLLGRVYDALRPGGTIVISEFTPNEDRTGPANALIFALNMLVNTDEGSTYTFSELRSWLTAAGFKDVRQLEAPAPSPLILANKPS
jgi:ubiquinone/menaquinone biosynthesis C-methylase UbiE